MQIHKRNLWLLAATAALFVACSSDSSVVQVMTPQGQVFEEDEYESYVDQGLVDAQGNIGKKTEKGAEAGSSTSKAASSGSKGSGSSASSEGDSGSETDTSSDTGTSSDSKSTSDGTETASSDTKPSSTDSKPTSSDAETTSSGTGTSTTTSSSSGSVTSSATAGVETVVNGNDEFSVGTNDMEEVNASTKTELDDLKDELDNGGTPEGFENVGTSFDETTMTYESFNEGDYYCFTGEGEWMHITRELLGQYIPHYKNGAAWGNLRHFEVLFMDACEGVYFRHK